MAQLPSNFVGLDALQHIAEQVSTEIFMGPGYSDASEMDRLSIDIVSGVQFKRTIHILLRKGGTTRRKDVHKKVNSEVGFLKERTLTVKLSWDHYTANADDFCETVFGVGAQEQFPLTTQAVTAILTNYADNLAANLWWGDIDLDKGEEETSASDQANALYDGFHTCVRRDIEDGIISEANGNLVPCEPITAPADNNDTAPYDNFIEWTHKWDARLRKAETIVYMSELTAQYIAAGYANTFHGNFKVDYQVGDNFKLPGLSKVTICPVPGFGEGDRMYATIKKNFVYGVDTLSNQTYVGVKIGTDDDMRAVQFQIQSIQGAGIRNPFKHALCVSDGTLLPTDFVAGDYTNSKLTISIDEPEGAQGNKVQVNGVDYKEPVETSINQILTLKAVAGSSQKFVQWSNGAKTDTIQVTGTGTPLGFVAFFAASV